AIEHQQIEGAGGSLGVIHPTMQRIEHRHAICIEPDHFSVHDCRAVNATRVSDNQRVALGPVGAVDSVETNTTIADVDLQSIAVMLEFVRPAGAAGRLLGDDWLARMDESSRSIQWSCRDQSYAIPCRRYKRRLRKEKGPPI